jgi:hypothetical protein
MGESHLDLDELEITPEAFLWRVFQVLVTARIFSRDDSGRQMTVGPDWRPILQQDLQLGNIIL